MADYNNITGHSRQTLFTAVTSFVNTPGVDFGAFNVNRFSRFTGLASTTGSMTVRYRSAIDSGQWLVSSTFVVNSGPTLIDVLNVGARTVNWDITAANSQIYTIGILAEPVR